MAFAIRGVRLRNKIVAWSFFPTAIILTIVALVGFYAYQQVTETRTIESSRELTRLSADQLSAELAEYGNILQTVSRLADFNDAGLLPLRAALARAANRMAIFDGGSLILDTRGTVIATQPARADLLGADWSGQTFYHDMVRSPGTVFSLYASPQKSDLRVVVIAVPLTGGSGELLGILVGMFRLGATSVSPFYGSIVKLRIGTNETAYLVDRSGVILYHTDANLIGADLSGQPVAQALAQGNSGAVRTKDLTGHDIVASYAPVPGTDWGLVIEQDWGTLLASGQDYGRFLLLLLILGLIVPAVVVTISVRRITDPIETLIGAAQEVAGGKFGQEIAVHTGDELEELVKQFNLMSAKLSETYAALQERDERFRLVTERANDGIWDWDIDTGEVYYSPRWKGMLGYEDHEIANRFDEWQRLVYPDDLSRAMAAIQSHLDGHTPVYNLEHRLRHKDGSYRWILARGIATRDSSGKACRMVGSHTDITERKQAEETIRQSEKRFAQIFNSSPVAISVTTFAEGRYVDANDAWLNLFGYSREEVIGNSSLQLNIWAQPEQRTGMILRLQDRGSVREFEHLARTKNGQIRDVLVSADVTEIGNERYNLSMVLDITEQKRAAEEMRRQNIYLAALHETTLGIMSRLDATELLETTITRAVDLVGAEYGWIYLVTPEKDAVRATIGTGQFTSHIGLRLKAGEGLVGAVWESGQPIAVADYRAWSGQSALFEGEPNGPVVGVPLRSGMEVVGVIGLARAVAAPPFRPDEIDLMSRFAQLASIALENARLHTSVQAELSERQRAEDALEQRLELERLITNISTQFINLGPNEIDTGIQHALQAIGDFAGADRSYVYQYSNERSRMRKTHEWCASGIVSQVEPLEGFPLDRFPFIRQTVIRQSVLNISRVADLPLEAINEREEFEREGVQSLLCVPIVYRGADMGYLGFHTVRQEKQWNDSHTTLLKITGEIFANALENQRAQEELQASYENLERRVQERTHELAALNTIASVVSRSLDLNEILTAALEKTLEAVGMEFGGAYRLEESRDESQAEAQPRRFLNPLVYRGLSEAFVSRAGKWSLESSSTQTALESGQPFVWKVEDASPKFGMMNALIEEGIQQVVTVPLLAQTRLVGALYLATGRARSFAPEQLALLSAIGQQVGLAVDNARLYKAEQDGHAEAERRRQVADGLREMLAILNSMLPVNMVLEHIVSQARRLLQSDAAALFRLDRESQKLTVQASQGLEAEFVNGLSFRLGGRGAVAEAVRTKSPAMFNHLDRLLRDVEIPFESRTYVDRFTNSYKSVLALPLVLKDTIYGAIALYSRNAREFSEEDLLLARTFADQVALAVENAQLREQVREVAAVTERSRLARELHDSVTQQLYSMNLYAEAAARLLVQGETRQAADHLHELRDTAQEALREMRLLIFELRPLALEKTGLGTALQTRLDSVESRGGIKSELVVTGTEHLTSTVQQELYHIAQEALNNALKHSDAKTVQVRLEFLEESTCLQIHDDGVGFAADQIITKGGLGLAGMKERALRIGAKLRIESAPGSGTTIAVQVPKRT